MNNQNQNKFIRYAQMTQQLNNLQQPGQYRYQGQPYSSSATTGSLANLQINPNQMPQNQQNIYQNQYYPPNNNNIPPQQFPPCYKFNPQQQYPQPPAQQPQQPNYQPSQPLQGFQVLQSQPLPQQQQQPYAQQQPIYQPSIPIPQVQIPQPQMMQPIPQFQPLQPPQPYEVQPRTEPSYEGIIFNPDEQPLPSHNEEREDENNGSDDEKSGSDSE